ncbi:MAG: M6 family metalloprotease domain-containing protein, partial [Gemmatimonadota bacterium]
MLSLCLVPSILLVTGSLRVEAQQPAQRPASWSGSTPPATILGLADARPLLPLEFSRAWLEKVEAVRLRREQLAAGGDLDGMTPGRLAAAGAALTGTLRIPVIPIHYADVAVPFGRPALVQRLFGAGTPDTMSLAGYWDEVSGGLLGVDGVVSPWIETRHPARHYLPADHFGWSSFGRVEELRDEVLRAADRYMDFSQFDNDGPDGVPDSGDDDGFVDFIALVYALPCPSDGAGAIWPHRGAMTPFSTRSAGANGEAIRIADYVILPVVDPVTCGPLQVGVLAHEMGHALGLPDLYDYDGTSQGIGAWGLMGTGSHAAHHSPAHLGAWEKEQLGWVTVSWLEQGDSTIAVPPVGTHRTVYRSDGDDGAYLLLENRQRAGSDAHLAGAGLLIWSVDPERAELGAWNMDERRAAVSLLQADQRNDLAAGQPADAGDPFPGETGRHSFSSPAVGGLRLEDIRELGDVVYASVRQGSAHALLAVTPGVLRLTALADGGIVHQTVAVRQSDSTLVAWRPVARAGWLGVERLDSALLVGADPLGLPPGTYTDTVDLAGDDGAALAHLVVSFYIAAPGVAQVIASELPW